MGRRNHDAIGESQGPPPVIRENCVGDNRGGSETVLTLNDRFHTVCRQDFEGCPLGRPGQGMGVFPQV